MPTVQVPGHTQQFWVRKREPCDTQQTRTDALREQMGEQPGAKARWALGLLLLPRERGAGKICPGIIIRKMTWKKAEHH